MNSHLQIGFYSTQNVKSLKMGISDKQKLLLLKPWSKLVMHMLVALFLGFMEDVSWNRNGKKNLILLVLNSNPNLHTQVILKCTTDVQKVNVNNKFN